MDFYGRITDIQCKPGEVVLFIIERGSDIQRKVSLIGIHFKGIFNGYLMICANGNLLSDKTSVIIERFVILEILCTEPVNEDNFLSHENLIGKEVFVHSRI